MPSPVRQQWRTRWMSAETSVGSYPVEAVETMAEIAEATGCPLQTAYSRLHVARRLVEASLARAQQERM